MTSAGIASIVRIAYVRAMVDNPDVTFTQCSAGVWSVLEMNLGILCNSLAALKPFVRRYLPSLFTKTDSDESNRDTSRSSPKHSKARRSRPWGHSYYLHSVDDCEKGQHQVHGGKDDIVVTEQFTVEYDDKSRPGTMASGKADSTESMLAMQFPGPQEV